MYFTIIILQMTIAICWLTIAPESPAFLLKRQEYDKLLKCFSTVMLFNK